MCNPTFIINDKSSIIGNETKILIISYLSNQLHKKYRS